MSFFHLQKAVKDAEEELNKQKETLKTYNKVNTVSPLLTERIDFPVWETPILNVARWENRLDFTLRFEKFYELSNCELRDGIYLFAVSRK